MPGAVLRADSLYFKDVAGLKAWLRQTIDPFVPGQNTPFLSEPNGPFNPWWRDQWHSLAATLFESHNVSCHVPIEVFRWKQKAIGAMGWQKSFQSSGTTQSERSKAPYSHQGLEAYAVGAMLTFYHVLKRFFADPLSVPGISLVPTTAVWPDSSLAQMVAWCAELWSVTYMGAVDLQPLPAAEPVWLFGTAFDFVNAIDAGVRFSLPVGSVVIETGGTKGKSRSVTRDELYAMISENFGVASTHIVSEYGMCELASQAYDMAPQGEPRSFRFPHWVQVTVQDDKGQQHDLGTGALVMADPLRPDVSYPIRTQDLASVRQDGTFILQGRVPYAVLKGCSLKAGEVTGSVRHAQFMSAPLSPALMPDAFSIVEHVRAWLQRQDILAALTTRLGAAYYAREAIKGLLRALPQSAGELATLVVHAKASAKTWLFIGPQTHPVAILEPLLLALAAGGRAVIRIPSQQEGGVEQLLIDHLAEKVGSRVRSLPPTFRFGGAPVPQEIDAILAFCDDTTASIIREHAGRPVSVFGEALAFAVYPTLTVAAQNASAIMQQTLTLGQQGCLSLRGVVVNEPFDTNAWQQFVTALAKYMPTNMSEDATLAMAQLHEKWRYALQENPMTTAMIQHKDFSLILPIVPVAGQDLVPYLSGCRHTLPFFFGATAQALKNTFPTWAFTLGEEHAKTERLQGKDGGFPRWSGTHQGRAYFEVEEHNGP